MNIFENPFYILEVSARHNRQQINSSAEEKIFMNDSESESKSVNEARTSLIISERRLAAEIRYFPGIEHTRIKEIIEFFRRLSAGQPANKVNVYDLRGLALLNFAVYMFPLRKFKAVSEIIQSVMAMNKCFETINTSAVLAIINNDRTASGFPLAEKSEIERELHNYRSDVIKILDGRLSLLSSKRYIEFAAEIAEKYAEESKHNVSLILSDLIDSYELNIMTQLEEYEEKILGILAGINDVSEIDSERLSSCFKEWNRISHPLVLASKSRGMDNDVLHRQGVNFLNALRECGGRILNVLSDTSVDIHEKYVRTKYMLTLSLILKDNIADISHDLSDYISRYECYYREEERKYNICYETEIGTTFKEKFVISPEGISYGGELIPLDKITGVRWGAIKNSHHSGVVYEVAFQTSERTIKFNPNLREYESITPRFRKLLIPCITNKILTQLKNGETLYIGSIKFNDNGVFFKEKSSSFYARKFFAWSRRLITQSNNGSFIIMDRSGQYSAKSSYIYDMNTHILEALLREFFRKFNPRKPLLSSLL